MLLHTLLQHTRWLVSEPKLFALSLSLRRIGTVAAALGRSIPTGAICFQTSGPGSYTHNGPRLAFAMVSEGPGMAGGSIGEPDLLWLQCGWWCMDGWDTCAPCCSRVEAGLTCPRLRLGNPAAAFPWACLCMRSPPSLLLLYVFLCANRLHRVLDSWLQSYRVVVSTWHSNTPASLVCVVPCSLQRSMSPALAPTAAPTAAQQPCVDT